MRRSIATAAFAAVVIATLSGCAGEEPAKVTEEANGASVVQEDDSAQVADDEEAEPESEAGDDSAADTAELGETVSVGSWDVNVTDVVINANATIAKTNEFNEKPKGQFVLVTYEATYQGSERTADIWADLTWTYSGTDGQIYETDSEVTPADDGVWPTQARQGGTVRGQVVFDLPKDVTRGGILSVEGYDDDFDTVYADFTV